MSNNYLRVIPIFAVIAFCFLGFISLHRLTESPATWMDEGAINQVSMNLAEKGVYGYQIAPGHFISAEFLTTGYPVVYPVALSFLLFGKSLFSARLVMVLFLFLLGVAAYWYSAFRETDERSRALFPVLSLFLLVTFAPLYGHGKNVLGEIPGLAFFMFALIALVLFERGYRVKWLPPVIGVLLGLSMATKPLYFVLILPSTLFVIFFLKHTLFSLKEKLLFTLGMFLPLLWWTIAQSGDGSVLNVFTYGNPNGSSVLALVVKNSTLFFSEVQPIYFILLIILWWGGVVLRKKEGLHVSAAESLALLFSLLNFLSFLTTRGFYRYFFPSEVLALLFLPYALYSIMRLWLHPKRSFLGVVCILILLIGAQGYQLFFHSWVSDSRNSVRAAVLSQELEMLRPGQSVFFYHVPEAVLFLPHNNYYQYLRFADTVVRGSEVVSLLKQGRVDFVLVDDRFPTSTVSLDYYKEKSHFDKYILYEKK